MQIELTEQFNATTISFAEKFDDPCSHVFKFGNMFTEKINRSRSSLMEN